MSVPAENPPYSKLQQSSLIEANFSKCRMNDYNLEMGMTKHKVGMQHKKQQQAEKQSISASCARLRKINYPLKRSYCFTVDAFGGASPTSALSTQRHYKRTRTTASLQPSEHTSKRPSSRLCHWYPSWQCCFDSVCLCDTTGTVEVVVRRLTLPGNLHPLHHK